MLLVIARIRTINSSPDSIDAMQKSPAPEFAMLLQPYLVAAIEEQPAQSVRDADAQVY